jgi:2-polyprenyl-6-methoxyphenol hydroxylase-like FAD-dependent oxidoreductase
VSTHVLHPLGVAALARWGLLDRLAATDCPPIRTYTFDFGPFTISGSPGTADAPLAYEAWASRCTAEASLPGRPANGAQFFSPENVGAIRAAAQAMN